MVLGRQCADVSKLSHLLRAAGAWLDTGSLQTHDIMQQDYVERVLAADLDAHSRAQLAIGVADGGMGFRRATDVALPAFVASRIESRPYVVRLFDAMNTNGVVIDGLTERYDRDTAVAMATFVNGLTVELREEAGRLCAAAAADAEARAQAIERTDRPAPPGAPVARTAAAARLVELAGEEDDECPDSFGSCRLQRALCKLADKQHAEFLLVALAAAGRLSAIRRISDLRDSSVSVAWMWQLNRAHNSCLEGEDYAHAVRMRIGAGGADSDAVCGCCGAAYLGGDGAHCLCCAPAESTRGHNCTRNELLEFARLADATSEIETPGLISAALGLRPADVLTSVAGVGLASCALDVGIAAPDAVNAGPDCAATMRSRKLAEYGPHLEAMARDGVSYVPMVWTAWGRAHPETTRVMVAIAKRAARRRGFADHLPLLRRAQGRIGRAIVQRGVAMLKACRPRVVRQEENATADTELVASAIPARFVEAAPWAAALGDDDAEPTASGR